MYRCQIRLNCCLIVHFWRNITGRRSSTSKAVLIGNDSRFQKHNSHFLGHDTVRFHLTERVSGKT